MYTKTLIAGAIALAFAAAQAATAAPRIAAEQGFTIPTGPSTPLILKTMPDAVCDLHVAAGNDRAHTLRLYANSEGYVKVHSRASEVSEEDTSVQLDCMAAGEMTTYPLRLRAGGAATADMPAPPASMPAPKGSTIQPGLSPEAILTMSDEELRHQGYPPRPDASQLPDSYAQWLDTVSRPLTVLPSRTVSRSDIAHEVQAGIADDNSSNWSGYEARDASPAFVEISGEWNVPELVSGYPANTYSAVWIGLDGDGVNDLLQAGSEQDFVDAGIFSFYSYSTWYELLPNEPTEQDTPITPNPGDNLYVFVCLANSAGYCDATGKYMWTSITDITQSQVVHYVIPLGTTKFSGKSAEWIVERPLVGGTFAILSDYNYAIMTNAAAFRVGGTGTDAQKAANVDLILTNDNVNFKDNNLLSEGFPLSSPSSLEFFWYHFH